MKSTGGWFASYSGIPRIKSDKPRGSSGAGAISGVWAGASTCRMTGALKRIEGGLRRTGGADEAIRAGTGGAGTLDLRATVGLWLAALFGRGGGFREGATDARGAGGFDGICRVVVDASPGKQSSFVGSSSSSSGTLCVGVVIAVSARLSGAGGTRRTGSGGGGFEGPTA